MEIKYEILNLLDKIQKTITLKSLYTSIDIHYKIVKIPRDIQLKSDILTDKDNPKFRERFILNIEGFKKSFNTFDKLKAYITTRKYLEDMDLEKIKFSYVVRNEKGEYIIKESK